MNLKTVVRQNPGFYLGCVDDEYMLMSRSTGEIHSLNWVAASIWEHMENPVTLSALQQWMMNEFELDSGRSERDLLAVCRTMLTYNTLLIEKGDGYETSK